MKSLVVCTAILLATLRLGAQEPPAADQPVAPEITPDQVVSWIEQLDDDQFLEREAATENLVRAGAAAIDPLVAAMKGDQKLERDMRAVFVLRQIALSTDPQAEEAARQALASVAELRLGTASRNALDTLATLSVIREKRALKDLMALGAKSRPDPLDPFGEKYTLEINDEWRGNDEDLKRLRLLVNMTQLTLAGKKVTDLWLVPVREIQQLTTITINRANITDDALANLVDLPQLRSVQLKYVPVGNESLVHLAKLKSALELELYGTEITPEGAAELKRQLGGTVKVDHRLGAFLGISAALHPLGCMITDVRPQTAASNAGLMLGDIIISYNDNRVYDFDGLTALISLNRPKDAVELRFVRNVEIRTAIRVKQEDEPLGLTGQDHPAGCEITDVAQESIAAYLQVRRGDVIYQVNDQPVSTLGDAQQIVDGVKVGEPITIDFARGIELRRVQVVLGEWE